VGASPGLPYEADGAEGVGFELSASLSFGNARRDSFGPPDRRAWSVVTSGTRTL
jgi:hypothetical protein